MKIVWTNLAEHDLETIEEYIASDNTRAAISVVLHLIDSVHNLPENPHIGRAGRVLGTRELIITNYPYVVIYRVIDSSIEIIRVLHTSRKWD